jgi:hypothetical protein
MAKRILSRYPGRPCILALVGFCACIVLSSCGAATKHIELAKQSVERFHSQLDSEQYSAIYDAADAKFHSAVTEADFAKLLEAIHRKLGKVRDSNLKGENISWYTGQGATVRLTYDTDFASGTGTEEFVWHIGGDHPTLYRYNINSNDLITK